MPTGHGGTAEASLTRDITREPTEYVVDDRDRIVSVNPAWSAFARENGAADLAEGATLGRPLWEFISGHEVRNLYRALLVRVRSIGLAADIPFRCDAPDERRFMHLTVSTVDPVLHPGWLAFSARLERSESRDWIALLASRRLSAAVELQATLQMCSWCKRAMCGDWLDLEVAMEKCALLLAALPPISHGICPTGVRLLD